MRSVLIAKVSAAGLGGGRRWVAVGRGGGGGAARSPLQYRSRLALAAALSSADQSLSSAGTSLGDGAKKPLWNIPDGGARTSPAGAAIACAHASRLRACLSSTAPECIRYGDGAQTSKNPNAPPD
ncbi:unnamed protein product, partial [Iphiclides podalirius]